MLYPYFLLLEYIWYFMNSATPSKSGSYIASRCLELYSPPVYSEIFSWDIFSKCNSEYFALFINPIKILPYSLNKTHTSLMGHVKAVLHLLLQIPPSRFPWDDQVLAILLFYHSVTFWLLLVNQVWAYMALFQFFPELDRSSYCVFASQLQFACIYHNLQLYVHVWGQNQFIFIFNNHLSAYELADRVQ